MTFRSVDMYFRVEGVTGHYRKRNNSMWLCSDHDQFGLIFYRLSFYQLSTMASTPTTKNFSLHGKGLKLDTRADIEPYLKDVDPTIIEEIHFGGNTLGVDASQALAEFLDKTKVLKVSFYADFFHKILS